MKSKICPRCQKEFSCSEDNSCWCVSFSSIIKVSHKYKGCLCPVCFKEFTLPMQDLPSQSGPFTQPHDAPEPLELLRTLDHVGGITLPKGEFGDTKTPIFHENEVDAIPTGKQVILINIGQRINNLKDHFESELNIIIKEIAKL